MGRISEAIPDLDGRVRKVKLVYTHGENSPPKTFERAVHQLVKLV